LRFLLDVHVAASIDRPLADSGRGVLRASDARAGWEDGRLLALAVAENRVLATGDRDFSGPIFRDGAQAPRAVPHLRVEPEDQPHLADHVPMILANTDIDHHMVVARPTNLRLRPLPASRADTG
jgi:hypothetical protein